MIELKDNSTGSAFGPIIVMIDASRLGHSLATALKDRPHGMPVQPNRSLPLRPPPPIPKKNSPIAQAMSPEKATRNNESCRKNLAKINSKDNDLKKEEATSVGIVGINFYDSKGEEDNSNDKTVDNSHQKIPKDLAKHRNTKSLDNDGSDEIVHGTKRRKSSEYGAISHDDDSCKKRKISNFEWDRSVAKVVQKEKKRRGSYKTKRKTSIAEENPDIFGKEKFSKGINFSAVNPSAELKTTSQNDVKPQGFERVQSSDLPTIFKYRNSESTSPLLANKNPSDCIPERSKRKQMGSNPYKLILPKPMIIPKCPRAIPIELAHAMNHGDLRNSNIVNVGINEIQILRSKIGNLANTTNQSNSMKPKINNTSQTIDEIENTLPSMPSLEDLLQTEGHQDKLTLHRNQTDCDKAEKNLAKDIMPIAETRVIQAPLGDLASEINCLDAKKEPIQGFTDLINSYNSNKSQESILNLTTMLEIKIPGRSPELIILTAPQIVSNNGTEGSMANNSTVEAANPVSLFTGIQPAQEGCKKIEETTKIDTSSELREYRKKNHWECQASEEKILQENNEVKTDLPIKFSIVNNHQQQYEDSSSKNQPQYLLQHKSPVEFEIRIKDTYDLSNTEEPVKKFVEKESNDEKAKEITKDCPPRPKVEEMVRCRKKRLHLKLQKLYEEEAHLKYKMSQTSDSSQLTRLQQKVNCAEKKIENTQKYLNKLVDIENPGLSANSAPSRIHVRQDLVQKIPSPESREHISRSPLRSTNETDKTSPARSPPVSSPIIITISETDSASSAEETDTTDGKSPDNIKPDVQTDVEVKSNDTHKPENVAQVTFDTGHPLPDNKVENVPLNLNYEMTNNNVEYVNKNLFPLSEGVPPSVDTASINIPPSIRDPINYSLKDLNGVSNQKSTYSTPNLNLPPEKFDKEQSSPNYNCLPCARGNATAGIDSTAKFDVNNSIPSAVSDLRTPNTIRRTTVQENTNVHPISNYPVHRPDYRTTGNGSSMFSRDNGGANINLSSPLQGHSALPVSPSYYRNMTAQGYPIPAEPSPNHQFQTSQWQNQHPPTKPSMQFTPDQSVPMPPSILAAHLLKSQAQEAAKFASSLQLTSLAQSKNTTRTNPAKHDSSREMTAQFPSFANWAATQMTKESTIRTPVNNSTANRPGYKTTGSDMYKMAATAIDSTHTLNPVNTIHWAPQRPCPEQPRPMPNYPPQRSIPQSYRSDYPPNPQIPQNSHNGSAMYPGPKVMKPYPTHPHYQAQCGPQNTRSTEHSGNQAFYGQQNVPQYQYPTPPTVPLVPGNYQSQGNSSHLLNPLGMMHQQYVRQPPSYSQAMYSQWHSGNEYQKNYVNPQFNEFIAQTKPVDNNSTAYRPRNENVRQMPPSQNVITRDSNQYNASNVKMASRMYNMPEKLNSVIQDRRNAAPLELGGSHGALYAELIRKSSDRLISLKCSQCGMPGPKFNCFGCETAFYCNEQCQAEHWSTHCTECPKKMPKLKKVS